MTHHSTQFVIAFCNETLRRKTHSSLHHQVVWFSSKMIKIEVNKWSEHILKQTHFFHNYKVVNNLKPDTFHFSLKISQSCDSWILLLDLFFQYVVRVLPDRILLKHRLIPIFHILFFLCLFLSKKKFSFKFPFFLL